jgi:Fe-S-cluster containining protein
VPGKEAGDMSGSETAIKACCALAERGTALDFEADQSRLCRECARVGRTCCQGHDIYVTWGDCHRIFIHTRLRDFFEYRACSDLAYADQGEDPLWQQHVFRPDGSRRVLKRQANGDCHFLSSQGCQLPLTVRPLICRLFPHVYSAAGIYDSWDEGCPAARVIAKAALESSIAGMARGEAARWHQLLYDEVIWEGLIDESWINL